MFHERICVDSGTLTSYVSVKGVLIVQNVTHHPTAFLGVKLFNDDACILAPFMPNGNVNAYIQSHPHCDRRLIVSI